MEKRRIQFFNVTLFNLLRAVCAKDFIVLFIMSIVAFLSWNIGSAIWILKTLEQTSITTSITVSVVLAIFFLGIFNISFLTKSIIQDRNNGVKNLELRNGVKTWEMYWARVLACKIISISFIVFIILLHLIIYGSTPLVQKQFILTSITPGLCSLFAFDFLFTGLILLFASWSEIKLTLGITFFLFTLYLIFPILGLLPLMFNNSKTIGGDYNKYYYADKTFKLSKQYNNGITYKLLSDMYLFQDNFLQCIKNCDESLALQLQSSNRVSFAAIHDGLILDVDNIINKYNIKYDLKSSFALTTTYKNSFIYKFINTLNNSYNNEKTEISWFQNNKNYKVKYQLNEIFKKTTKLKIDPSINIDEIKLLNDLIYNYYVNELIVNCKDCENSSTIDWNVIYASLNDSDSQNNLVPDEKFKSLNSTTNPAVRLYTKILFEILYRSLWVTDNLVSKINNFWSEYDNDLSQMRAISPFWRFMKWCFLVVLIMLMFKIIQLLLIYLSHYLLSKK